jgi:nucleotide-binding universal stress UspA family protein
MKMLFPTDGSPASIAALDRLLPRLSLFTPPLTLAIINVHPTVPYARAAAWVGKEAVHKYYEEEGNAALAPVAAALDQQGIPYERVLRLGDPAHEVVRFANEWGADMIALGRHGHGGVVAILLGSVAQKIIATSPVPVLLID